MDDINYELMIESFNKKLKYLEQFDNDELVITVNELKSDFIDLFGDN